MIKDASPVTQALLGTLMTWGLTAAGAAVAFFMKGDQRVMLDGSLGFAAGVMLAASYWSLLAPAIDMAAESPTYGETFAFVPVAIGFFLGAVFVYGSDVFMSYAGVDSPVNMLLNKRQEDNGNGSIVDSNEGSFGSPSASIQMRKDSGVRLRRHRTPSCDSAEEGIKELEMLQLGKKDEEEARWKRILLLIVAITVHNIPEGLAVGVAFGAVGTSETATFENARNLAIGIGIQNFPEGLAVSLPLKAAGFSASKAIWYGQLSGLVEPFAGVLGALLVGLMQPLLPYALAFAAGAMVYVVIDDIIPEAQTCGNGKVASWGSMVGFLVMMSLDVGLG